jgi:hypothetical protein
MTKYVIMKSKNHMKKIVLNYAKAIYCILVLGTRAKGFK